ncbi:hypothetical protein DFH11DRAFT_1646719, partial [Phellopilus nigrolimitatus]
MHSIRSDVAPVDPSLVPLFISEIDISLYTEVALLTLLVYDTVITMDKEGSPRSFVSLIYFAVNDILQFLLINHSNALQNRY